MRIVPCLLLPLCVGCNPGQMSTTAGDYGIAFAGEPDCVEIDASAIELEAPFTVDLFVLSGPDPGYALYPLVVWPGAFALLQDRNGYTIFGPSSDISPGASASTPTSFMDGGYHHIAGVFDAAGTATLYLDGEVLVSAPVALLEDPGTAVYLGCWPGQDDAVFSGTIGEVRVQDVQHYDGSFAPTWQEYEPSDTTLALWHLNEGRGTAVLDDLGVSDGVLTGGEWVDFALPGHDPDDAPDTGE